MLDQLRSRFREIAPAVDFCSLRYQEERSETLSVRQGVLEPVNAALDAGVMVTVADGGGLGYAATSDLSRAGLAEAVRRATAWARRSAGHAVADFSRLPHASARGTYETPVRVPWASTGLAEKVDLLKRQCARLKTDDRIVDWAAQLSRVQSTSLLLSTAGADVCQRLEMLVPVLYATANRGSETVTRSLHGFGAARQGGLEVLDDLGFEGAPPRLTAEALALLSAPDCPSGTMDVVLAPDQMILQIHESIGHPLELDRILGDERNYAGTSFVTLDMFGTYRYGSELLNVVWDPTRPEQLASYAFDDEGLPAVREHLIERGILLRPLGGQTSQARAGVRGVATSRACSWNRPPIDRMANINLEPGDASLEDLVGAVERGVYMETNQSWSIDDSRNKFQFGCEYGRVIEDGELKHVVRKPNYRGISATFWRNLVGVGDESTFQVLGTPNCGKGEPNQMVRVGHASPACRFADVEVFGGA
jgi:predicted Zn-dependent protease